MLISSGENYLGRNGILLCRFVLHSFGIESHFLVYHQLRYLLSNVSSVQMCINLNASSVQMCITQARWIFHLQNIFCACMLSHVWLCDCMDCSLPGSSVHRILQAKILEWVAMPSSRGSSWPRVWTCIFCFGRRILYHWATWDRSKGYFHILLNHSECKCLKLTELNF